MSICQVRACAEYIHLPEIIQKISDAVTVCEANFTQSPTSRPTFTTLAPLEYEEGVGPDLGLIFCVFTVLFPKLSADVVRLFKILEFLKQYQGVIKVS